MEHKVKITVLKKNLFPELQEQYCTDPRAGKCPVFEEGQEFLFDWNGPQGFQHLSGGTFGCAEAWDCISRYIYTAIQGAPIMQGWMRDEHVMIACCNDGTRPVVFKIERLDEED